MHVLTKIQNEIHPPNSKDSTNDHETYTVRKQYKNIYTISSPSLPTVLQNNRYLSSFTAGLFRSPFATANLRTLHKTFTLT